MILTIEITFLFVYVENCSALLNGSRLFTCWSVHTGGKNSTWLTE